MLYNFELQMAGAILLTAMLVGGVTLWIRRRRARDETDWQDGSDAVPDGGRD